MTSQRKILFIDRDGTIVEEPADEQVDSLDKIRFVADVIPALFRLRDAGYEFVMVTNQDGLGSESYPMDAFEGPQQFILDVLSTQGITFAAIHVDSTFPSDGAETRKPGIGLVRSYLGGGYLDFERSAVIGDRDTDLTFAANMGIRGYRVGPLGQTWTQIADEILDVPRVAVVERSTAETHIRVRVALGESGSDVSTGIGFFDHMLDQVALHGGFGLRIDCDGDLHVDEHHTIEDCALALGSAFSRALGDRRGIGRFGFVLPMDEAQATIAVDLGGRPFLRFEADFARDEVGGFPTEMVPHFFRSLAQTLGATIHINVTGENTHHMIEAVFKGFGRALRPALVRESDEMPSSKGVLV
jgi:imidazoleglycerol-phosphate dehydratase/histidinol-phosphatase